MAFVSGGDSCEAHNLEHISERLSSVFAAVHPLSCLYLCGIWNTASACVHVHVKAWTKETGSRSTWPSWWMAVMLHLFLEVISFSFSLLELLQKRRKKCVLDQEIKFSWIASSSVAGPVPACTGLAQHDHVFVNRRKHSEDKGEDNDLHRVSYIPLSLNQWCPTSGSVITYTKWGSRRWKLRSAHVL